MRILILSPRQDRATGNYVTARRFQRGLEAFGAVVRLAEVPPDHATVAAEVAAFVPDLAILLHAYRTGRPWLEAGATLPFLVLLTGTDVHQGLDDPEQRPWILRAFREASVVASQNPLTCAALRRDYPQLGSRLHYLPPGIELGTAPYALRKIHGIPPETFLFFCPASLRPVKGVLELIELFDPLARMRQDFIVAFCGPELDTDYARRFHAALSERPWARYFGIIPAESMPAAMMEADVILNNSVAEGLPNALLEATVVGRPILARDIPGNAAVVRPGENGLLYGDGSEFLACASRLLDDGALRELLSLPDLEGYRPEREAAELRRLCEGMLGEA